MKILYVNENYPQKNSVQSKKAIYFTGKKIPSIDIPDKAILEGVSKPSLKNTIKKVFDKIKPWGDSSLIEKQNKLGKILDETKGKIEIPEPKLVWSSNVERSWYLNNLAEKHIQNDENNMSKIMNIFNEENTKSKLTNQELGYLRNGVLKMKPIKDGAISEFLDIYKKCVPDYSSKDKPVANIHLKMILTEKPEATNMISSKTLIKLIQELERTGGQEADMSLIRVIPSKVNGRFTENEMQEINTELQKTSDILNKRIGKEQSTIKIPKPTIENQDNIINTNNTKDNLTEKFNEIKPARIIPKFECEHPVGSKEYFDARLKFLHKTGFDIATSGDAEGFIKFLDMFDELNKVAKSTNKDVFTEFGEMKANFSLLKNGQRSDKLLNKFLDTYHTHIEDFGSNLDNDCGARILTKLYREYGEVSSKATIMKLLKEFERTGTDEYISVKGIGEPFAMEHYFKHFTLAEQKEITTESERVSNILKERSKNVDELRQGKKD